MTRRHLLFDHTDLSVSVKIGEGGVTVCTDGRSWCTGRRLVVKGARGVTGVSGAVKAGENAWRL